MLDGIYLFSNYSVQKGEEITPQLASADSGKPWYP